MISGKQAHVCFPRSENPQTETVLRKCCERLGISSAGRMCLVSGADVVPARTQVSDWPGIRACGEISEYQLVVQQSKSWRSLIGPPPTFC
eukprot:828046-Amphidinium_carterae.1